MLTFRILTATRRDWYTTADDKTFHINICRTLNDLPEASVAATAALVLKGDVKHPCVLAASAPKATFTGT